MYPPAQLCIEQGIENSLAGVDATYMHARCHTYGHNASCIIIHIIDTIIS